MGFSRQEYWSGLPFPSLGDLPDPGIEPGSPALQADSTTRATMEAPRTKIIMRNFLIGFSYIKRNSKVSKNLRNQI